MGICRHFMSVGSNKKCKLVFGMSFFLWILLLILLYFTKVSLYYRFKIIFKEKEKKKGLLLKRVEKHYSKQQLAAASRIFWKEAAAVRCWTCSHLKFVFNLSFQENSGESIWIHILTSLFFSELLIVFVFCFIQVKIFLLIILIQE